MSNINSTKSNLKFFFNGFLLGFTLLVFVYIIELINYDLDTTSLSISKLHQYCKSLFVFDFLPIIFGFVFFFYGQKNNRENYQIKKELQDELAKSKKIFNHITNIYNGDLDSEYIIEKNDDEIGKLIISLQDELKKNKQEEIKRKQEDNQRNWTNAGYAKFGELLRQNNDNLENLAADIIINLVKYVDANQGGFFLLNDENIDEKYYELISCFAYDRKKFADKRIEWGEGLIGTCGIEMDYIFITDIPDNYLSITSGLGNSNPRSLLLVPLKTNEQLCGVIELASFKIFEQFEIDFVREVAESIASTIVRVKTNLKTVELLEQSQIQAEKLAQHDEEMRQNLEELQATQEQVLQQSEEFEQFASAVNHTMIRAEYTTDGFLIYSNTKFIEKLGYDNSSELEGKNILEFIDKNDKNNFKKIWETLAEGGKHFEGDMKLLKKNGEDLWMLATFVCKRNALGKIEGILFLATDITDKQEIYLDSQGQIAAINLSNLKAEFLPNGQLLSFNKLFEENLHFDRESLLTKSVFELVSPDMIESFNKQWEEIVAGNPFKGVVKLITEDNETKWFQGAFATVNDNYNNVIKVIYIANDITEQKVMEIETLNQAEKLKIQDEKLRHAQDVLTQKLEEARKEMKSQFEEIETIKIRNELTLEGMLDANFTIDHRGKIQFFNKAAVALWGYTKEEVMNQDVEMLFSKNFIDNDDFINRFVDRKKEKIVGVRQEVCIKNKYNEELSVLFLISEALVNDKKTYTAFVQNIEIELF